MLSTKHLSNGKCTGAVIFRASNGVGKLQVRMGDRGRGLFAASPFKTGQTITTVAGSLVENNDPGVARDAEKFQWSKTQVFVMEHTGDAFGIFANTAASQRVNNAKYVCNRRNHNLMRLCATRNIDAGQEILAPYGRPYVSQIKMAVELQNARHMELVQSLDVMAPVVVTGGAVARMLCANCGRKVKTSNRKTHARCCLGAIKSQTA